MAENKPGPSAAMEAVIYNPDFYALIESMARSREIVAGEWIRRDALGRLNHRGNLNEMSRLIDSNLSN